MEEIEKNEQIYRASSSPAEARVHCHLRELWGGGGGVVWFISQPHTGLGNGTNN